ncbi:hypothetical protein WKV44_05460 [Spirochaetia bacterium 38H-sp]|uniref:MalT-like TPR region domain-containing protein n=1 Tax=Rarispira pelagica TaxID=3141764 RepID=A0ABU9UBD7_9SPIR
MNVWVLTRDMELAAFVRRKSTMDFYNQLYDMLFSLSPASYEKNLRYIKLDFSNIKTPVELQKLLLSFMSIARYCKENRHTHCGVDIIFDNVDISSFNDIPLDVYFYNSLLWSTSSGFKLLARYVTADRIDGLWEITGIRDEDPLAITSRFKEFPVGVKQNEQINRIFYLLNTDKVCTCYSEGFEGLAYTLSYRAVEAGWFVLPVSVYHDNFDRTDFLISLLRTVLTVPDIEDSLSSPYLRKRVASWRESFLYDVNPAAMEYIIKELLHSLILIEKKVLLIINVSSLPHAFPYDDFFSWLFDSGVSVLFCLDFVSTVPDSCPGERVAFPLIEKDVLSDVGDEGERGRFFIYSSAILRERGGASSPNAAKNLISALLDKEKKVYYALLRLLPFFTHDKIKEILNLLDVSYVEFEEILSWLEGAGLLFPGVFTPVYYPENIDTLMPSDMLVTIKKSFNDLWLSENRRLPYFLLEEKDCRKKEDFLVASFISLLTVGAKEQVLDFVSSNMNFLKPCGIIARDSTAFILAVYKAYFSSEQGKIRAFVSEKVLTTSAESAFSIFALLVKGRFLRSYNPQESIRLIKEAVYLIGDYGKMFCNLESYAYMELAMSMASLAKLKEAQEYLKIADSYANHSYVRLFVLFLSACLFYLEGNYTRALLNIDDLKAKLADMDLFELYAAVLFLEARIAFELGDWQGVIKTLVFIEGELKGLVCDDVIRLCNLWKARAYFYSSRYDDAFTIMDSLPKGLEHRLFAMEHEAMSGDFTGVLEMCDKAPEDIREYVSVYDDILPAWFTGFSMLEDRIFYESEDLRCMYRLIYTLKLYARGMMGDESVCEEFVDIIRKAYLRTADPYTHLYHLWYGEVLIELEKKQLELPDHSLTIIGKAVRLLQMRASKIENARHRRAYLFDNYWNSRLMELARRYKLSY